MEKRDLNDGMVVQTEMGNDYLVVGDRFIGNDGFLDISEYGKNLKLNTHKSLTGYDVIKVYNRINRLKQLHDDTAKVLIWDRQKEERRSQK